MKLMTNWDLEVQDLNQHAAPQQSFQEGCQGLDE
jgi:hypothetical protein